MNNNDNLKPINSLAVGDVFRMQGIRNAYVVDRIRSGGGHTVVSYHVLGTTYSAEMHKPGLTDVIAY